MKLIPILHRNKESTFNKVVQVKGSKQSYTFIYVIIYHISVDGLDTCKHLWGLPGGGGVFGFVFLFSIENFHFVPVFPTKISPCSPAYMRVLMGYIVSRDCSISVTVSRENIKNFTQFLPFIGFQTPHLDPLTCSLCSCVPIAKHALFPGSLQAPRHPIIFQQT
jgi:hypothetical protein